MQRAFWLLLLSFDLNKARGIVRALVYNKQNNNCKQYIYYIHER